MNRLLSTMTALAAGAAAMYVLDPEQGRRRRARLRDRAARAEHALQDYSAKEIRDLRNRSLGFVASLRARLAHETVPDAQLEDRVRAHLGHLVLHPGAIDTEVHEGCVRLTGDVLAREMPRLLAGIAAIAGVKAVDNQLTLHDRAGRTPALQGEGRRARGPRGPLGQSAGLLTRAAAGAAGACLSARALAGGRGHGRPSGLLLGLALCAYALAGDGRRRRARRRWAEEAEARRLDARARGAHEAWEPLGTPASLSGAEQMGTEERVRQVRNDQTDPQNA